MAIRLRQSAGSLKPFVPTDDWDPVFEWYARGIREMQTRSIDDPTSWRYQAAIHAYDRSRDRLRQQGEALPSLADQRRFWNQCQHASWFFLPWHRMYLAYFEQIVQAAITALAGPDDWALPYWNYSDTANPRARRLPLAFTLPAMPNGDPNPLRIDARLRGNDNAIVATPNQVSVRACLTDPTFDVPPVGGLAGFGGPQTGFMHAGGMGAPIGKVENTPHNTMHGAVGGFMGAFNTAGLDPLFWLHHANIDRLWVVWRDRNPQHLDPALSQWLTGVSFFLHDAQGAEVAHAASEVVDTTVPPLNYRYDTVADPLGGVMGAAPEAARRTTMAAQQPEMVGASEGPIVLTGGAATTRLAVSAPTGPAALRAAAEPPAVHLNIENVTGLESEGTYAVYLNVPEGESPEAHPELFAGLVPMFGVPEATRGDANRPGDGLTFSLEITDVVRRLEASGAWADEVRVTFAPEGMPVARPAGVSAPVPAPITVGRVSLYYA
ncbi:MAG TPA: tyrosinase family protein [Vicinamibacterales bacterium]|nr:tyrosinase family protein [Vicinamibacterales bacterium]